MEKQGALGNINTILYNNKTEKVLMSGHRILVLHGSTGNGKSMLGALKFMSRVFNAPREQQTFVLAGRDITTLEKRFVEANTSVFNWFPFRGKWEYKKLGVGGSRIIVKTRTGEKYIYFTPFRNRGTYERVLGQTINGLFVDEAVEADEFFLQEIMARVMRTAGTWGIFTSNGGDPDHYFYQHIINRCVLVDEVWDDIENKTPIGELRYMDKERLEEWLYVHMSLLDNPVYTTEDIEMMESLYPSGSFMHYSRVLGVRGFAMDSPFAAYMEDVWVGVDEAHKFNNIVFSVDSGGHVFSNKDTKISGDLFGKWYNEYREGDYGTSQGGHTVMVSGAFNRDYTEFTLLDVYFPNHMHQNINVDRMYDRVYGISSKYLRVRKPYMFVDNADTNMLSMLRDKRTGGIGEVRPAIKRDNSIGLDEPIVVTLIQQYLMRGKFKVLDTKANREYFYRAMMSAGLEKDYRLVDNRSWESDVLDGLKYIFSSMYRLLVRGL